MVGGRESIARRRSFLIVTVCKTKATSIGQVSADSVGRYSTDTRPSIDRVSTDISVDISADSIGRYFADTTFSTHDPF